MEKADAVHRMGYLRQLQDFHGSSDNRRRGSPIKADVEGLNHRDKRWMQSFSGLGGFEQSTTMFGEVPIFVLDAKPHPQCFSCYLEFCPTFVYMFYRSMFQAWSA